MPGNGTDGKDSDCNTKATSLSRFLTVFLLRRLRKAVIEMEEVWKDIVGYEGLYMVSNKGNIKSLNYMNRGYEHVLKPKQHNKGYLQIQLKSGKDKTFTIHRLVAQAFIPNPHNYPFVNHKDENRKNNSVSNLEWCDDSYNVRYSMAMHPERFHRRKTSNTRKYRMLKDKKIKQFDMTGNLLKTWNNSREIHKETNMSEWAISECCRGNRKKAYGYIWQYAN